MIMVLMVLVATIITSGKEVVFLLPACAIAVFCSVSSSSLL